MDLPVGGTVSPVDALKMLLDLFTIMRRQKDTHKTVNNLENDLDGSLTLQLLKDFRRLVRRITGNDGASLGLHPAVYFYDHKGRHSRFLFLGVIKTIAEALINNDKGFFKAFTNSREKLEAALISKKSMINQALANVDSKSRIDKISNLIKMSVKDINADKEITNKIIINYLGLDGTVSELTLISPPTSFSRQTKSAVFMKQSLETALSCDGCKGRIDPSKSVSYDHITRVRDGGKGTEENLQLLHPYCNTAIKG